MAQDLCYAEDGSLIMENIDEIELQLTLHFFNLNPSLRTHNSTQLVHIQTMICNVQI